MSQGGLVFEQETETALIVRDTLSNQQYRIESSGPMEIKRTECDDFPGPVSDAITIDTGELRLSGFSGPTVRDANGRMQTHLGVDREYYETDWGTTFLELHTSVKSYLRIEGGFGYESSTDEIIIDLPDSSEAILGARAWRCYPTSTITVSESPEDLREAISHFGDGILTSSPERSFSTLRGYPPRLRVGNALHIPDSLSKPDSGVTITVPSTTSALLTVTPLAYYLSATVEVGEKFTVETENGFTYEPDEKPLFDAVRSVLTRCFYLDCLARTEGLYPLDLQERHDFETRSNIDLGFEKIYDQSLAKRIETYLQVDTAVIEAVTAEWPMTAVVEPDRRGIESLPYLVYELSHIRPESPPKYRGKEARRQAISAFSRDTQEARSTALVFENEAEFVDVPATNSQQTIWVGEGIPMNASKFLLHGYEHDTSVTDARTSSKKEETPPSELEVTVVCNEESMAKEVSGLKRVLDPRDNFPMEVSIYSHLTTGELRRVLEAGTDYLHFIGHATPDGLQCTNDELDVATIEQSNVTTFFLNACQSYQQGTQLVRQGSSGGIVTYSDISDTFALRTSGLIGRLLNEGFAVGTCLSLVRDTTPIGRQYTVVGSHNAKLIQPTKVTQYLPRVAESEDGYALELTAYSAGAPEYTIGGLIKYDIEPVTRHQLIPSSTRVEVTGEELREFLSSSDTPVVYEGNLQTKAEFFDAVEG